MATVIAAKGEVPDWAELHQAAAAVLADVAAGAALRSAAPANDAAPKGSSAPANDIAPESRAARVPEQPLRLGGRGPP